MGYPYGPQQGHDPYAGQGYAQPGYGPDPYGGQQGYPQPYGAPVQNGYGAPAYGAPYSYAPGYGEPRAGGGTAITAAVISLLLSLIALGGLGIAAAFLFGEDTGRAAGDEVRSAAAVSLLVGAAVGLLWLLGAILLFRRKTAGRVILILLSTLALIFSAISIVAAVSSGSEEAGGHPDRRHHHQPHPPPDPGPGGRSVHGPLDPSRAVRRLSALPAVPASGVLTVDSGSVTFIWDESALVKAWSETPPGQTVVFRYAGHP